LPNNAVRSLFLDDKNILWIGTEKSFTMQNGEFSITMSQTVWDIVVDISQDIDGNMWFASHGGGVSKFDKQTHLFLLLRGLLKK
jgi:ligand-binding sensor domain-containing protein